MDDLLADFVAESREMLDALAGEVVAWEANPSDRARLDAVFRFVHTVKGNCGFFDFPRLEALSHAAEDALADVRAGQRPAEEGLVSAVLAIIDRISAMLDAIERSQEFPAGGDEELIAALAPGIEGSAETLAAVEPGDDQSSGESSPSRQGASVQRTIRLSVDLLDRVMSGVSDMAVARNLMARHLQELGDPSLDAHFNRLSAMLNDVRDAITRTRMQRIDTLFTAFPRLVRDLSNELGKQVMVDIESGSVELDREMIDLIRDPLIHLIRNAVDHGIESPAERRAAGKREIGMISIAARQTGNMIRLTITDDGRGIDLDKVTQKALAAGIVTPERLAEMPRREQYALICEPGFSTREQATAVSGRGVGMDVVRANIERFGGSLWIYSKLGENSTFVIDIPLTLSIVPSITVMAADQKFAITRSYIDEIARIGNGGARLTDVSGIPHVELRGHLIPCFNLRGILKIDDTPIREGMTVVTVDIMSGQGFALAVDEVIDHEELVIKPIAPAVMATGIYVGTAQMDDGTPVLMLEMANVARELGTMSNLRSNLRESVMEENVRRERKAVQALLFMSLDGNRRAVPMRVVDRIEDVSTDAIRIAGDKAQVVLDGKIYPLAGVSNAPLPEEETVKLFRLKDGTAELAYAAREVLDIVALEAERYEGDAQKGVAAILLINDVPTELVDCYGLFADHRFTVGPAERPVCRLPANDRWLQDFLRPLIEAAGYDVVDETTELQADIAIASCESEGPVPQGARSIWLRATPEPTSETADTIYRYDRETLMSVLQSASLRKTA